MQLHYISYFIIGALIIVILTGNAVIVRMRPNIGGDSSHERSGGGIFGFLFSIFLVIIVLSLTTGKGNWVPGMVNDFLNSSTSVGQGSVLDNRAASSIPEDELTVDLQDHPPEIVEEDTGPPMPESLEDLRRQTESYDSGVGGNGSTSKPEPEVQLVVEAVKNFYFIQRSASTNLTNATAYKEELLQQYSKVMIFTVEGPLPYRVGHGPFTSEEEAQAFQSDHNLDGKITSYIFN